MLVEDLIKKGAFLVDVRTPSEFNAGHVNNSVNIPLDSVEDNLEKFKNKEQIIVFCRSGNRSAQAKMILEHNGFENVTNAGTWEYVNHVLAQ